MKNALLISLVLLFGFTACQNKQHNHDESKPETSTTAEPATTATATPQVAYACPMHPEVTGKAGDKCPKCKMDLQPVEPAEAYACPMHPEVTGKAGDKCPKCKMDLQPVKK